MSPDRIPGPTTRTDPGIRFRFGPLGPRPGVDVDVVQLRREQRDRAARLPRALDREPGTDWDTVRAGVRLLLAAGSAATAGRAALRAALPGSAPR
ncbi:DUF5984 family protein [Kitasatospora sp. NBC_01560]|uniref:DUF5984 family protein n=1 Tax=Kitasatospora sp. NBC_01560 TaxID=2975965 RepID=UPI0038668465